MYFFLGTMLDVIYFLYNVYLNTTISIYIYYYLDYAQMILLASKRKLNTHLFSKSNSIHYTTMKIANCTDTAIIKMKAPEMHIEIKLNSEKQKPQETHKQIRDVLREVNGLMK